MFAWKLVAPLISAFLLFLLRDPGLTHGWRLVGHGWIPGRKPRRCCRDLPRRKMDLAVALRWEPPRAGRGGPFLCGGRERDVREATQAPVDFHRAYLGCRGDPRSALIRIHGELCSTGSKYGPYYAGVGTRVRVGPWLLEPGEGQK